MDYLRGVMYGLNPREFKKALRIFTGVDIFPDYWRNNGLHESDNA